MKRKGIELKVARAISARRNYGEGGLRCMPCFRAFESARLFVSHQCYVRARELTVRGLIVDRLKALKPAPAVETLRGEQLPLELK